MKIENGPWEEEGEATSREAHWRGAEGSKSGMREQNVDEKKKGEDG